MADRTEFLPLGGEQLTTDAASASLPSPTTEINNFIPVVVATGFGGSKQVSFKKRRGYEFFVVSAIANYSFSHGMQWTAVVGSGTSPSTARGVIVYTEERAGADLRLYKWDSAATLLGTFATANYQCIGIQETLISGVANLTLSVRLTSSPWTQKILYFPNGGALTENTDGDLPTGIIGCGVNMDGYYFFAANSSAGSNIWNTDLNSLSAVTATSFIAVQSVPDTLIGLARIKNLILGLGTRSIEFFQNVGNASGSPLQRIDNAALTIGVLHQLAALRIGDNIIFVSVSEEGLGVHVLSGGQAKKVSTEFIDAALADYADDASNTPLAGGLIPLSGFQIMFTGLSNFHGVNYAVLLIGNIEYGYAPSDDSWITVSVGGQNVYGAALFTVGAQNFSLQRNAAGGTSNLSYSQPMASLSTSGADYLSSAGLFTFPATLVTVPITHGTPKTKFAKSLRILGELQSTTCNITVSYSDDGGATYKTWGNIDMSANPPQKLTRGGSYRRRIYKFSNQYAAGCSIDGVEETYEIGLS